MEIEGVFTIKNRHGIFEVRNTLVLDGIELFLRSIWRAEAVLPADFYIGLTNLNPGVAATLAGVNAGEPAGHGYARQAATRGIVDWTVTQVSNAWKANSKQVTFTASSNWDKAYNRLFVCNAAAGAIGKVFCISGPSLANITVLNGDDQLVHYDFWWRP